MGDEKVPKCVRKYDAEIEKGDSERERESMNEKNNVLISAKFICEARSRNFPSGSDDGESCEN